MTRALISVSQDGFTYLSLNGATSRYSDTGQAMTYLGDYARETATPVSVTIDNGNQGVDVLIDETGKVGAAPSGPPASTDSTDSSTQPSPDSSADTELGTGSAVAPEIDGGTTSASGEDVSGTNSPASTADDGAEAANGEEYPLGTPFSGPATPAAPKVKKTRVRKHAPRNRPQRLKKITVPGLVLIGIAILMIGAFVIPNIVPSGSPDSPQTIGSEQQVNPASELSVDSTDDVVPSFSNSPKWETKVPKDASVTASDRGVLVVNKGKLQVLDATTGEERYSGEVDEAPTFAVDTIIDGKPALLWQAGDTAEALFDGESEPMRYQLPQKARITSAGTSVLIKSGNKLSTFGADGLVNVPTPEPGSTPMAIENDELFSSDWNGPVKAENIKSGDERSIDLEPPADDLQIIDWISAGHGKAITLWGEQGASTNSGHRIQLVVHSLEDGSILSTVTTTTDIVGEMSWVRGQGGQRAYIGPYLFNLENGLLLMDTSSKDINLSEPRGTIVPCTIDNEASCLLAGQHAYRTDTRLLAMTDGGNTVIVDGEDSTIRAYDKKSETQEQ
ncbi:hypothetical protein ACH82I_16415 [Brevibacterium sp. GP-SGM9]|uniref:hypothetical protein n=1 Tax=Brevibacterium sp. GP-SGM9 TaxID=3376990 RepID=UPI0039A71A44